MGVDSWTHRKSVVEGAVRKSINHVILNAVQQFSFHVKWMKFRFKTVILLLFNTAGANTREFRHDVCQNKNRRALPRKNI